MFRSYRRSAPGLARAPASLTGSETKEVFEDIPEGREDIFKTPEASESSSPEPLDSVAIVDLSFFWISEHFIGLGSDLKFLLGLPVPRVSIRMVLHGDLSIALLNFFF